MPTGRIRARDPSALSRVATALQQHGLLALLPPASLARLVPHLALVNLRRKDVLFRAYEPLRTAYLPTTAVVSLVSTLASGESLEVGLAGRGGVAGAAVFPGMTTMPCDGVVQIPGEALRIRADVLRDEAAADESLSSVLGRLAQLMLARTMQMSVCNMFHPVEQRCIRWLLMVSDVLGSGDVPLTHDLMATMLGVHRPTVTLVIRSLHQAGLVSERRGLVVITDRCRLEHACCECYRVMREEQRRLLGF